MVTFNNHSWLDGVQSLLYDDVMSENILLPALGLVLLTFIVGLILTIASTDLMRKNKSWEESGIPIEPYKDAPLYLKLMKNNISNLFEFPVLFYFLIAMIIYFDIANAFLVICAWIYLVFRVAHSIWHICFTDTNIRGAIWVFSQTTLFLIFVGSAYILLS